MRLDMGRTPFDQMPDTQTLLQSLAPFGPASLNPAAGDPNRKIYVTSEKRAKVDRLSASPRAVPPAAMLGVQCADSS